MEREDSEGANKRGEGLMREAEGQTAGEKKKEEKKREREFADLDELG